MLDLEGQWSEYLARNNITGIIQWLRKITENDDANMEEVLPVFSCWVQKTSELAKKELLTLCFSHCQGLWMFLDRSSFTRVHILLQKLRNLLTLAQWSIRHHGSAHCCHGCCDACEGCWNLGEQSIKQHMWLGRLVQWWGIMGLLPKYPEAQEERRISQMWREMDQSHRRACAEILKEEGMDRGSSFIGGMVCQLVKQHGCIWMSEDYRDQYYPPPNLQALLRLVLVPCVDNISVQAVIMYFVLDMANFLQCRDDLLQSFCHAFTIPSSFSQQIRAFWLLDHGHTKASMELLLSPRAAAPQLSWQHRYIIHCLLLKKQPRLALRYLQWARPAMESVEEVKLCADVLLQNSRVSEAWALLRRGHSETDDLVTHFLQACDGFGLCAEALKYIPDGYSGKRDDSNNTKIAASQFTKLTKGRPPCPLSARLYQAQRVNAVSSEELVKLVTTAVMEVRQPHPKIREVVWPQHTERPASKELFLSTEALCHLTPSPCPINPAHGSQSLVHRNEPDEDQSQYNQPETPEHMSSSGSSATEGLSAASSVSSFTSASSLPPLSGDRPYVYESTLTLQRISALLTDGLNHRCEEEASQRRGEDEQDEEEEEDEDDELELEELELEEEAVSTSPSSADLLTDSSELTVTLDGSSAPISLMNLTKDISAVLISTGDEDAETHPAQRLDPLCVDACSELPIPETLSSNDSFDPVSSFFESHMENHSFLLPGEMDLSLHQEDFPSHIFSGAATSDSSQEERLLQAQRACDHYHQEETEEFFRQDVACSQAEIFDHLQTDVYQCFQTDTPIPGGSQTLDPAHPLITDIKPSSFSSHTPHESPSHTQLKKEDISVQSTSSSWWKHNLESYQVSSSQRLPVSEAGADSPKRPSVGPGQPYSYSLFNLPEKHRADDREGKQADKEYAACWSSLEKGSQGAIRTRSRKGKRAKRT